LIDEPRVIKACGEVKATSSELDKFRLVETEATNRTDDSAS